MSLTTKQVLYLLHSGKKPSPQELREWYEMSIWRAQCGLWSSKRKLERANSNEEREEALSAIKSSRERLRYTTAIFNKHIKP